MHLKNKFEYYFQLTVHCVQTFCNVKLGTWYTKRTGITHILEIDKSHAGPDSIMFWDGMWREIHLLPVPGGRKEGKTSEQTDQQTAKTASQGRAEAP